MLQPLLAQLGDYVSDERLRKCLSIMIVMSSETTPCLTPSVHLVCVFVIAASGGLKPYFTLYFSLSGTLEAHSNGFRFNNTHGSNVDITTVSWGRVGGV